jgi:hypothetical protein
MLSLPPATITVTTYTANSLALTWPAPTDTGVDASTIPVITYVLEVDENFGSGYMQVV